MDSPAHPEAVSPVQEKPHPFDLLLIAVRHRWKLLILPLVAGLLAFIVCLILPPYYVARVSVLPPNLFNTALRFNPEANAVGRAAEQFTIRNQSDVFAGLLQSPLVLDRVLDIAKVRDLYSKDDAQLADRKSVV